MLLLGLASGVHCVAMCGGFAAAFSGSRVIPIAPERKIKRILLANAMLLAVGLHLAGATRLLGFAEKAAAPFWRAAAPLLRAGNAYVPGLAWGFVPCGLVYGALAAAAFAGSAAGGAAAMLAYGLGTLPWLLGAGWLAALAGKGPVRVALGAGVFAFGVYGLAHAGGVAGGIRGLICL
jgi:sulfite exporter TauE/SafE